MSEEENILEIEEVEEVEDVEESPEDEKLFSVEEEEAKEEEAKEEEAVPSVRTSVLTELEYSSLSKTLSTISNLKASLKGDGDQTALQHINLLEISIWDDLVKKFGFRSVEDAQSKGYTFGLRQLHVVECRKNG